MIIAASAPGNLMLMGEHAVLHGELAIACAVEQRIHVRLETLSNPELQVESALANYSDGLDSLKDDPQLRFVLAAVRSVRDQLRYGIRLTIQSEFSHKVGLGSSAAVSIATVAALEYLLTETLDRRSVFLKAKKIMLEVQGRGSGTDLAASCYGALIAYRVEPLEIIPLTWTPEIGLYYSGYKTPTPTVLARVAAEKQRFPELYQQLYRLMGQTAESAVQAAKEEDLIRFGQLMNYYQGLMDALGVNDQSLSEMVYKLRANDVKGAKISGSGLGDCVISLGKPKESIGYDEIDVKVASEGVRVGPVDA
ncbi:MAG: mevalonate kinase [Motiliproteus sp.]|nr:mevalonate kinase [Motiliproteus sp.]MCW9054317.1 mevalonate kinase [Motiliproteus sp.]